MANSRCLRSISSTNLYWFFEKMVVFCPRFPVPLAVPRHMTSRSWGPSVNQKCDRWKRTYSDILCIYILYYFYNIIFQTCAFFGTCDSLFFMWGIMAGVFKDLWPKSSRARSADSLGTMAMSMDKTTSMKQTLWERRSEIFLGNSSRTAGVFSGQREIQQQRSWFFSGLKDPDRSLLLIKDGWWLLEIQGSIDIQSTRSQLCFIPSQSCQPCKQPI